MASQQGAGLQRYLVMHVATTCDEHGVYVTKDSAETIEIGWILLDSTNCEEVSLNNSKLLFDCYIGTLFALYHHMLTPDL